MKVVCVRTTDAFGERVANSPWLDRGETYDVLEIVVEASKIYLRIQGSQNTPALFDMTDFDVVDGRIPENWIVFEDEPGCLRFTPKAWAHDGFWTNYFNGEPDAVESFQREVTEMT